MKISDNLLKVLLVASFLTFAGVLLAQTSPTVVINGASADVGVRQFQGRWYIDLEALAMATNGTFTIAPNRIELNLPAASAEAPAAPPSNPAPQVASATPPGLSRTFASAAIGATADMREWRGAVEAMITYGLAVSSSWAQDYEDRAQASLMQAQIAARTDDDQQAAQLLQNEFNLESSWTGQVLAARQALNGAQTVNPNALQDDTTLAKLRECTAFLDSMLVSGTYEDNAACH